MTQLKKAMDWLNRKCYNEWCRVMVGNCHVVAFIFRLRREGKPDVRYCVDVVSEFGGPKQIKRICI